MAEAQEEIFDQLTTNISGVPSHSLLSVWERVTEVLERVVTAETGYTLDDILLELHDEQAQLWVVEDFEAVIVTKLLVRPRQKALWVWYVAGDNVGQWIGDLITLLEAFAKHHGCDYLEFSGRKGWAKYCKPNGYRVVLTTFRKDLR